MNNFFRAIIAGYGAKKLGGGCFGTILVFVLIWVALGQCSFSSREVPPPETYPAARRAYIPSIVSPHPPSSRKLSDVVLLTAGRKNLLSCGIFAEGPREWMAFSTLEAHGSHAIRLDASRTLRGCA